jgi:hypothetical protein
MIWIKKLLNPTDILSSWKLLVLAKIENLGSNHIWYGNSFEKCHILNVINPFWKFLWKMVAILDEQWS